MCNLINSVNNSLIQAVQYDQDTYHISFKISREGINKPENKSTAHIKLLSPVIFTKIK